MDGVGRSSDGVLGPPLRGRMLHQPARSGCRSWIILPPVRREFGLSCPPTCKILPSLRILILMQWLRSPVEHSLPFNLTTLMVPTAGPRSAQLLAVANTTFRFGAATAAPGLGKSSK